MIRSSRFGILFVRLDGDPHPSISLWEAAFTPGGFLMDATAGCKKLGYRIEHSEIEDSTSEKPLKISHEQCVLCISNHHEKSQELKTVEDSPQHDAHILETERKQAEAEIETLARFPGENPHPVMRISRDGVIEYANDAAVPLLNSWKCSVSQPLPGPWSKMSRDVLCSGLRKDAQVSCGKRIFSLTFAPIRDAGYVNIYGMDITELTQLAAQLRQAQKMEAMGKLASGIAHDFNNILSAVIGYTELAMDGVEKGSLLESNLSEVLKAGGRAKDLVKQILTFTRRTDQALLPVQIMDVFKEALKLLRASLPTTIEIRSKIESDSLVAADSSQIHQVLMNLCTNAAHAMRENGGILEVGLRDVVCEPSNGFPPETKGASQTIMGELKIVHPHLKPGRYTELSVSDTGHGITPEVMENIFDPFFTTKRRGEGTGMGLSLVHGIVENHGGSIEVQSDPGKGSIFRIYLPVVEKRQPQTTGTEKSAVPYGNEHVLLVDDEGALADIGKRSLESLGYAVDAKTSSIEALELFKSAPEQFDVVVSDMMMPKISGKKLAEEIARIRPDIPVIICTGFSENVLVKEGDASGIRAVLVKPLMAHELATGIRKVLDA
jgi:signal transduction histidine kinase